MIAAGSRYSDSAIVSIEVGGAIRKTIVPSQQTGYAFTFVRHLVRVGDRVDTLAAEYYNDAALWWRIADGNPEILDWMDLLPGTILRIPRV